MKPSLAAPDSACSRLLQCRSDLFGPAGDYVEASSRLVLRRTKSKDKHSTPIAAFHRSLELL
jgi:hypothetical protein